MKLTIETRDKLLYDNFDLFKRAYSTNDKKLKREVQLSTLPFHNQKCNCTNNAVMNKLKAYYISEGLYDTL